jgi:hypothetical protein
LIASCSISGITTGSCLVSGEIEGGRLSVIVFELSAKPVDVKKNGSSPDRVGRLT